MAENSVILKKCSILGKWVGETFGTHHCRVFAEGLNRDDKVFLELRLAPSAVGVSIFSGQVGTADIPIGSQSQIILHEVYENQITTFQITLTLQAISEDVLEGDWQVTDGAKGIVRLSRHKTATHQQTQPEPVEIIAKEYQFGNLRIYKNDIEEIIKIMEQLSTTDGHVFVTEEVDGVKKTTFAKTYLAKEKKVGELQSLTIAASLMTNGFNNSLVLNLEKEGNSTLSVQSPNLLWFYSTPMAVKELLEKRSSKIIELYKKHGLNINFLVFLTLLVWMPSLEIADRVRFATYFLIFTSMHAFIHKKSSLSLINQKKEQPSTFKEKYPAFSYVSLTIMSAVITGIIKFVLEKWEMILNLFQSVQIP